MTTPGRSWNRWGSGAPLNPPGRVYPPRRTSDEIVLDLDWSEQARREFAGLPEALRTQVQEFIGGLPQAHQNDVLWLLPRDSRIATAEAAPGVMVTYILALSLGKLLVAKVIQTEE